MNIVFWLSMLVMLFVAIGILILPLVRISPQTSIAYKESNLGLYKSKLKELELDLEEDRIDKEHYMTAVSELDHELLTDVPDDTKQSAALSYGATAKSRPVIAMLVAIILPAISMLTYLQLGMHAEGEQVLTQESGQDDQQLSMDVMIQKLADRLNSEGGTAEGWAMLGRAYKHTKQYANSSDAFAQAIKQEPSARLYLEQAEALALANGQSFVGESRALIMKALKLEPDNINVIWFAGVAEFQTGNFGESIDLLISLSAEAKEDAEIDKSLRFYVSAAREKLIADGVDIPSVDELLGVQKQENIVAKGVVLEVGVDINHEIRELFKDSTVVFVYAKAVNGPKMPLAVQRLKLSDLPTTVALDDSMAMVEGMSISAFESVLVSARVSISGSAIAQTGDYIGSVLVDNVSAAKKLNISISKVVN